MFEPEPGQMFAPVTRGAFWLIHAVGGKHPLAYRIPLLATHRSFAVTDGRIQSNGYVPYTSPIVGRIYVLKMGFMNR